MTGRERRAKRALRDVAVAALRHAETSQDGDPSRAPWLRTEIATLTRDLTAGLCPECGRAEPDPHGLSLSMWGVDLGRCCGSCSADLREIRANA